MNSNLDINNNKTQYAQFYITEWHFSFLSCLLGYLSHKEASCFFLFNPDTAVVSSCLSLLRWHPKAICHLLDIYNILVSASPALLFLNSPEVFSIFQLLEILSAFHRQPNTVNQLVPTPNQFIFPASIFPYCTQTRLSGHYLRASLEGTSVPTQGLTSRFSIPVWITWSFPGLGSAPPHPRVEVWTVKSLGVASRCVIFTISCCVWKE